MSKLEVRLTREQVNTIRQALGDSANIGPDTAYAEEALRLRSWLTWRADKMWGTGHRGESLHKQAS